MTDLNKSYLTGRLTKDADMTNTNDGKAIARFTLAVSRGKTKDGTELTDFIGCVAFDKIAEKIGEWTKKGHRITVETRQQSGSYTNKDGQKVYTHDNVVLWWQTLERKQDGTGSKPNTNKENEQNVMDGFMDVVSDDAEEVPI